MWHENGVVALLAYEYARRGEGACRARGDVARCRHFHSCIWEGDEGEGGRDEGEGLSWKGHRVTESFIARLPLGRKHPQAYLPLMLAAARSLKLDGYDLIVSRESGPIKGIRKPVGAYHVCYCHTPMRYLWDMHDEYYRSAGLGGSAIDEITLGKSILMDMKHPW